MGAVAAPWGSPRSRSVPTRVAAILILALVGSVLGVPPTSAETSADLAQRIADGRRAQAGLENTMRAGDAAAAGLRRERRQARRGVRTIDDRLGKLSSQRRDLHRRVGVMKGRMAPLRRQVEREARRAAEAARRAEREAQEAVGGGDGSGAPGEEQQPTKLPERAPSRAERSLARLGRDLQGLQGQLGRVTRAERLLVRRKRGQVARVDRLTGAIGAAESRAAWAAAGLSDQIGRVAALAERRAAKLTGPLVDGTHLDFIWPTRPRITQPYGCTGFGWEPPRGSCAHFHDGIDLGPGHGAKVVAAADGVVAYVGWSPLGVGDRSYIVVLAHGDGHESTYGHLLPTEHVRVGYWVAQGETIGLVGDTGRSTGSHLHWEVKRGGRTVDPESLIHKPRTLDDPVIDPAAAGAPGPGDGGPAASDAAFDVDPVTGSVGALDAEAGARQRWSLPSLSPDPAEEDALCPSAVSTEALPDLPCAGGS